MITDDAVKFVVYDIEFAVSVRLSEKIYLLCPRSISPIADEVYLL